jgi:secondary thiamine-phosphate synthase enzyme
VVVNSVINIETQGNADIIDITSDLDQAVLKSKIKNGTVTIFVMGSTAGVTTIEYEPGLVADFQNLWDRIVPKNIGYQHDLRWGDGNGFSHVSASMLGPSLTIPIVSGKTQLGTWQQIIIVDFDNRPRSRDISFQIVGEL